MRDAIRSLLARNAPQSSTELPARLYACLLLINEQSKWRVTWQSRKIGGRNINMVVVRKLEFGAKVASTSSHAGTSLSTMTETGRRISAVRMDCQVSGVG